MPDIPSALIHLGTLIGFFEPDGSVSWKWFGDPIEEGKTALPAQREKIGAIVRALVDRPAPSAPFSGTATDGIGWEPVVEFDGPGSGVGVTWTMPVSAPLVVGVGAKAAFDVGDQEITLGALARIMRLVQDDADPPNTEIEHALGEFDVDGTFPVPDFLRSGSLTATIVPPEATIGLTAMRPVFPSGEEGRILSYSIPSGDPEMLAWDAARLATFVVKAFIAKQAPTNDFCERVLEHLFPMIGDPSTPIKALPIVAPMDTPAEFSGWAESVLPTGDGGGALLFLWHLRALLTGNEDPSFWNGSFHFPLVEGPSTGTEPDPSDLVGPYPDPPVGPEPAPAPGAWVGMLDGPGSSFTIVLDLWNAAGQVRRIPIATWTGSTVTRPPFPGESLSGFGGDMVEITPDGVVLLDEEVEGQVLRLVLRTDVPAGSPPVLQFETPWATLAFPQTDAAAFAGDVTAKLLEEASANTQFDEVAPALADVVRSVTRGQTPDVIALLTAAIALGAGVDNPEIVLNLGDGVTLTLALQGSIIDAGVGFGPVSSEAAGIVIGRIEGSVSVTLDADADHILDGFRFAFSDLRIGPQEEGGGGIVASLIPDMREMSGFSLAVEYHVPGDVTVTGGGKIPIQRTFGPLEIAALLIELTEDSFAIGIDLGFELGPIAVAAYELGVRVGFDGTVEPFLHGLGLSMETDVVSLGGFFAAIEGSAPGGATDYVGGALVSVAGYFQLSAIGGYTKVDDDASLFIFASLVAPLGGPPWFFMTGVAGGFGLNRALPNPELMLDHPFLRVMSGELDISGDAAAQLQQLSIEFRAEPGQFWVAAGIQFISFGFITGRVVVAIEFGHRFSIAILGMASFSLEPLAYIEIGILTQVDEEKFVLRASISPHSYVLHPDIFSLQGDIAMCAWYADPHKGDFLFSIGGYHPEWKKPDHYPDLVRVGAKASLYDFVHLEVGVFFTCTPQALMAGAKVSVWGEFMGIAAGLDVYVDVLMTWDPFYLKARIGVVVWFEFFGRHEIGVRLSIYTPEFGGTAEITVIVTFTISFGADEAPPPPPSIADFLTRQVALPAKPFDDDAGARVTAFNTDAGAGLFRVELLDGRVGGEPPDQDEKQEGLEANAPIRVGPEWSFLIRSRIPIDPTGDESDAVVAGEASMPLTTETGMDATLGFAFVGTRSDNGDPFTPSHERAWLTDFFPAATFGPDELPEADQYASDATPSIDSSEPSVPLLEGFTVECRASVPAPSQALAASGEELSDNEERYPLPLGAESSPLFIGSRERLLFADALSPLKIRRAEGLPRRSQALAQLRGPRILRPLHAFAHAASLLNPVAQSAGLVFTADAAASAAVPVMAPPPSPSRPLALAGVTLKTLPIRSDHVVARARLDGATRAPDIVRRRLTKPAGARKGLSEKVSISPGEAHAIEWTGDAAGATLRLTGNQHVRTVAFDRGGSVVADHVTRGRGAFELPKRSARVVAVGAGAAGAPEAWGIERGTTILAASRKSFLAPGCVVTSATPLGVDVQTLDGMPAVALFAASRRLRLSMAHTADKTRALVIRVVSLVDDPEPAADQVRWRTGRARLRDLTTVVSQDRAALVMAVQSDGPWTLDIDLGPQWRLDGVAVVPRSARDLAADLARGGAASLVDDSVPPPPPRKSASTLTLQVRP